MALPCDQLRGPSAYGHSDEDVTLALRAIDRCIPDLRDRVVVAEALVLLPYVARARRADRTSGPRVERRPS